MLLSLAPAGAAEPDVQSVVAKLRAAVEPAKPGVRRMTLTHTERGAVTQVTLGEARKAIAGKRRILLVTLAPANAAGTAYLVEEGGPGAITQWFYVPYVRRVRKLVSPEAYSAFLNSDFTYADLGFVDTGATYTLLDEGTQDGRKTYRVEGVPRERWYYARWVTTLDAETGMPLVRELYDSANQLWKRQRFEHTTVVDGVALPSGVSMEDLQAKSRTEIRMTGADYDVEVPDALFDPATLPDASSAPVWAGVGQ